MKNFVKKGEVIDFVNGSGSAIKSGDLVVIGTIFGVAQTDIAIADTGAVLLKGVFVLAKAASQAWAQGAKLYWDATAKNATTTASGNTVFGVAHAAALSADVLGEVQLVNGI